ncbi:receptor-transporting protein 4-like isoform X2 [Engystomops pustulosus]|uniref:receptor-transporting protein 4-like isoform X2 n=1 Tax=Engystomops pustulosus TaxID=76066 RepID=UPI003AFACE1F
MDAGVTWSQIFASEIHRLDDPCRWNLHVDGNLMKGNDACYFTQSTYGRHSWISSKVFILFRMDLNKCYQYGDVTMRIFRQECKKCSLMQQPKIQPENIKRAISNVVSRIQRVFYENENVNDTRQPKSFGDLAGPHDEDHCEACQLNLCQRETTSSQESSSSVLPAIGVGAGVVVGIGALALLFHSLSKTKDSKRGSS